MTPMLNETADGIGIADGDLPRDGQVVVLLLAQPAQAIGIDQSQRGRSVVLAPQP